MSDSLNKKGRIPVRPLSYDNKDLAFAKEIIIDYKSGVIYVKLENGEIVNTAASETSVQYVVNYIQNNPNIITNTTVIVEDGTSVSIEEAFTDIYKKLETVNSGTEIKLDTTLTKEGYAADAGVVGNAISNIKDTITEEFDKKYTQKEHSHEISDVTDLQTALDGKAPSTHGHKIADIENLQTTLDGKAPSTHGHEIADIENLQTTLDGKAPSTHGHEISDVTNLQTTLDGKAPSTHEHEISDVTNLQTELDGKAPSTHGHKIADIENLQEALNNTGSSVHTHKIADIENLQSALDGKAPSTHGHEISDVTDLQTELDKYLHKENGGTINGNVTFNGKFILGPDNYGSTLPSEAVEGQLFFMVVDEEDV